MNEDKKSVFELADDTRIAFTNLTLKIIGDISNQRVSEISPALLAVVNESVSIIIKH